MCHITGIMCDIIGIKICAISQVLEYVPYHRYYNMYHITGIIIYAISQVLEYVPYHKY